MGPYEFTKLIEGLTGRPVYSLSSSDEDFLIEALKNDKRIIDYSQFNELLLIVNKDRVTELFFNHFFGATCEIGDIENKIEEFRKTAMLCFGNFIYAYRTLSKSQTRDGLEEHLVDFCKQPKDLFEKIQKRGDKILEVKQILRNKTYLIGYLSAGAIRKEHKVANDLNAITATAKNWDEVAYALRAIEEEVKAKGQDPNIVNSTAELVENFRRNSQDGAGTVEDFRRRLERDLTRIQSNYETLEATLAKGTQNTDIYLSWDYMDVYFATSMRRRSEYEELYDFVNQLMNLPIEQVPTKLAGLNVKGKSLHELRIRYFDPTQSYDKNRINKGLIEALMLKRAACTVYSVQDTDTLGKDSELAATLAQGKPVIAYAPPIHIEKRAGDLEKLSTADLKTRSQFVSYMDDERLGKEEKALLSRFIEI